MATVRPVPYGLPPPPPPGGRQPSAVAPGPRPAPAKPFWEQPNFPAQVEKDRGAYIGAPPPARAGPPTPAPQPPAPVRQPAITPPPLVRYTGDVRVGAQPVLAAELGLQDRPPLPGSIKAVPIDVIAPSGRTQPVLLGGKLAAPTAWQRAWRGVTEWEPERIPKQIIGAVRAFKPLGVGFDNLVRLVDAVFQAGPAMQPIPWELAPYVIAYRESPQVAVRRMLEARTTRIQKAGQDLQAIAASNVLNPAFGLYIGKLLKGDTSGLWEQRDLTDLSRWWQDSRDYSYTWSHMPERETAYRTAKAQAQATLGRELVSAEVDELKKVYEDPGTELFGGLVIDLTNLIPIAAFDTIFKGGKWALGKGWQALKITPGLGDALKWASARTVRTLAAREGSQAFELFSRVWQAAPPRTLPELIEGMRDAPYATVGPRGWEQAKHLAENVIPAAGRTVELGEETLVGGRRVVKATGATTRVPGWAELAAEAEGLALRDLGDEVWKALPPPEQQRRTLSLLARRFEEEALRLKGVPVGGKKYVDGFLVAATPKDVSIQAIEHLGEQARRLWIEANLYARPGFTVINWLDSGLRAMLSGASLFDDLGDILRRLDFLPRDVTAASFASRSGGWIEAFAREHGRIPTPVETYLRATQAGVQDSWLSKLPVIGRGKWSTPINLANAVDALRDFNAAFEFSFRVRAFDRYYWNIFRSLDEGYGVQLAARLVDNPKLQRAFAQMWASASDHPERLIETAQAALAGRGRWEALVPPGIFEHARRVRLPANELESLIRSLVAELKKAAGAPGGLTVERLTEAFGLARRAILEREAAVLAGHAGDEFLRAAPVDLMDDARYLEKIDAFRRGVTPESEEWRRLFGERPEITPEALAERRAGLMSRLAEESDPQVAAAVADGQAVWGKAENAARALGTDTATQVYNLHQAWYQIESAYTDYLNAFKRLTRTSRTALRLDRSHAFRDVGREVGAALEAGEPLPGAYPRFTDFFGRLEKMEFELAGTSPVPVRVRLGSTVLTEEERIDFLSAMNRWRDREGNLVMTRLDEPLPEAIVRTARPGPPPTLAPGPTVSPTAPGKLIAEMSDEEIAGRLGKLINRSSKVTSEKKLDVMQGEIESLLAEQARRAAAPPPKPTAGGYLTEFDNPKVVEARAWAKGKTATININTPERVAWRQKIVDEYLAIHQKEYARYGLGLPERGRQAYLIVGLPGSGKTSNLVIPTAREGRALVIEQDVIKSLMPEYNNGIGGGLVHAESSLVAQMILAGAVERGDNLVWQTVGKNVDDLRLLRDTLLENGYNVHLRFMDIEPREAARRAVARFTDENGHFVAPEYILGTGLTPRRNYLTLIDEGGIESHYAYTSEGVEFGRPPRLLAESALRPVGGRGVGQGGDLRLEDLGAGTAPEATPARAPAAPPTGTLKPPETVTPQPRYVLRPGTPEWMEVWRAHPELQSRLAAVALEKPPPAQMFTPGGEPGTLLQSASGEAAHSRVALEAALDFWERYLQDELARGEDIVKQVGAWTTEERAVFSDVVQEAARLKAQARDAALHGQTGLMGAIERTNARMVDYQTEYNLDGAMKFLFPFWKFPSRSLPFWLEQFVTHPQLLAAIMRERQMGERYAYQRGATTSGGQPLQRLRGYLPLGESDYWWNPLQPFSFRQAAPTGTTMYDEPGEEADPPLKRALGWLLPREQLLGFNLAPWVEYPLRWLGLIDENRLPRRSVIGIFDLTPPWAQRQVLGWMRKTVYPNAPDTWTPQVGWKDYLVEREVLTRAMRAVQAAGTPEEKDRLALAADQALYDHAGAEWDAALRSVEGDEYWLRTLGYFTGIYPKRFPEGEQLLLQVRNDINVLQRAIQDETGYGLWKRARYETPEGRLRGLYGEINVRSATGMQVYGPERREELRRAQTERRGLENYYLRTASLREARDEALRRLPIGAPSELTGPIWENYQRQMAELDAQMMAETGRLPEWSPGAKPPDMIQAHLTDVWMHLLLETRPAFRADEETWTEYQAREQAWEAQLPNIAASRGLWQRFQTLADKDGIPLAQLRLAPWLAVSTAQGLEQWDKDNDDAYDALNRVWRDNYWDTYWQAVEGRKGYDREVAESEFKARYPDGPTETQLLTWLRAAYPRRFTDKELLEAIRGAGDVMEFEQRQTTGQPPDAKRGDEIWRVLMWAGPNKASLRDALGNQERWLDFWYMSDGNPAAFGDREEFTRFYDAVLQAASDLKLARPDDLTLREMAEAEKLNDEFKARAQDYFGANIQDVQSEYFDLSAKKRKAFLQEHPELATYWDFRDQWTVDHPEWTKYYRPDKYVKAGESVSFGTLPGGRPAIGYAAQPYEARRLPRVRGGRAPRAAARRPAPRVRGGPAAPRATRQREAPSGTARAPRAPTTAAPVTGRQVAGGVYIPLPFRARSLEARYLGSGGVAKSRPTWPAGFVDTASPLLLDRLKAGKIAELDRNYLRALWEQHPEWRETPEQTFEQWLAALLAGLVVENV